MVTEAALLALSCVLFVQMGLGDAIQRTTGVSFRIMSCPKCLTMWVVLSYLLLTGRDAVQAVAASFVSSYCAMWAALVYDAMALLYNRIYEKITETDDTPAAESPDTEDAGADEVSQMQQ